jgi:hypothetical protein
MNSQELRALQEAYLDVYDEGYKDLDLGKKLRMTGKAYRLRGQAERDVKDAARRSGADSTETQVALHKGVKKLQRSQKISNTITSHSPEAAKAKEASNRSPIKVQRSGNRVTIAMKREQVDLYDIILSHLLDEGYADTQQAAEAIMVNMSEDWRESIVEGEEKKEEPQKPFTGEGPKKPKGWRPTGPKLKSGQRPGYAR